MDELFVDSRPPCPEEIIIEPQRLEVTRLTLPLPRLPEDLRGFTIGHLSDMHLQGKAGARRVAERACAELMALQPELICLSGDVVDHAEFLPEGIEPLRRLAAPLPARRRRIGRSGSL